MLNEFIRTHKLIVSIIGIFLLIVVILSIATFISRIGKEQVGVYLVPSDAHLTVNGQEHRPGTTYLEPGDYKVKAEKDGFASYEETVQITQSNTTNIDIALTPVSDEAKKWQQDNMEGYFAFEGRAGEQAVTEGIAFSEKNPIVDHLPFSNYVYTVGYRADPDVQDGIIITIDTITGYRQAGIRKIRELGFDPTDYKIEFINYENPFNYE